MFSSFQRGKDTWDEETSRGGTNASPRTLRRLKRLKSATFRPEGLSPASTDSNGPLPTERTWLLLTLRPSKSAIDVCLDSFWRRWTFFVLCPSILIWIWCGLPFPYTETAKFDRTLENQTGKSLVDANFWFFLVWFFGCYQAVNLLFITSLFNLYRLNWWPKALGGKISYFCFWLGSLLVGLAFHQLDLFGVRQRWDKRRKPTEPDDDGFAPDWERKTVWIYLASLTMAMPALVCFLKLRKDRRQTYRHSMTEMQRTFLERQLAGRMPRSYKRFLWFMVCNAIALFTLAAGQGYASVYLSTLPHNSIEGVVYVYTWVATVQILQGVTIWVLGVKVRSRALLFIFRFYFFLAYFVFYRTLFARLRSPDQYLVVQIFSSLSVLVLYPVLFSKFAHWLMQCLIGYDKTYEEHCEQMAQSFFLRDLAGNISIVCFLGYLTILHFGPNVQLFPFFSMDHPIPQDPYNYTYKLTFTATTVIWVSEMVSSFLTRALVKYLYTIDITNAGLNELRAYPELMPAILWTATHLAMDCLLFLCKLNFT